jgi:hypothetical protein
MKIDIQKRNQNNGISFQEAYDTCGVYRVVSPSTVIPNARLVVMKDHYGARFAFGTWTGGSGGYATVCIPNVGSKNGNDKPWKDRYTYEKVDESITISF